MDKYAIITQDVSLKNYSTLGVGGTAKYLALPYSEQDLSNLLKYLDENKIKWYILGNASNVIIDDSDFDGVIIKLDNLDKIEIENNLITCGAGVMMPKLVNIALQKGLTSLSFAAMIPGTVGGCVVGNAGAYGYEVMQYVKEVKVIDKDYNIKVLSKDDISFGYRYTSLKDNYIVLSVTFISEFGDPLIVLSEHQERNEKRINTQPLDKKNVGSIFRNPENVPAGKLIEDAGLKGYQIGDAKVSEKHANFIINENNASFEDIIKLIDYVKSIVKESFDVNLVLEPTIIRWQDL